MLGRRLNQQGMYPPVALLPSLSCLIKDGIGKGRTRADHPRWQAELYMAYAHVQEVRSPACVIGGEDLAALDRQYIKFGQALEARVRQPGAD